MIEKYLNLKKEDQSIIAMLIFSLFLAIGMCCFYISILYSPSFKEAINLVTYGGLTMSVVFYITYLIASEMLLKIKIDEGTRDYKDF